MCVWDSLIRGWGQPITELTVDTVRKSTDYNAVVYIFIVIIKLSHIQVTTTYLSPIPYYIILHHKNISTVNREYYTQIQLKESKLFNLTVQGRMLLTKLETSARTENKRMTNHNTPQLSRMNLSIHCATFPGLSLLNTRAVRVVNVHVWYIRCAYFTICIFIWS
jgi:hypothetical protein